MKFRPCIVFLKMNKYDNHLTNLKSFLSMILVEVKGLKGFPLDKFELVRQTGRHPRL